MASGPSTGRGGSSCLRGGAALATAIARLRVRSFRLPHRQSKERGLRHGAFRYRPAYQIDRTACVRRMTSSAGCHSRPRWPRLVAEGRDQVERILTGEDPRLLVIVGPVLHTRREGRPRIRRQAGRARRPDERHAPHRHARLLREAAHQPRLEGPHQRPEPRRLVRHIERPLPRAKAAHATGRRWAYWPGPSSWTPSRPSTSPTS